MLETAIRHDHATGPSTAPEIGDCALIGDCRTAALVSRTGSIDWLRLPHFSGPSVFAALLDPERGGRFALVPAQEFRSTRRYLGATPVLETTFETATGTARLTDLMPVVDAPGALQPMREILRILEGIAGEMVFEGWFDPRPDYARQQVLIRSRGALGWACCWKDELLLLQAEAPLQVAPGGTAVSGQVLGRARGSAFHWAT
jgi:GH15 family glucan-1,4-alpha-glucosidase